MPAWHTDIGPKVSALRVTVSLEISSVPAVTRAFAGCLTQSRSPETLASEGFFSLTGSLLTTPINATAEHVYQAQMHA